METKFFYMNNWYTYQELHDQFGVTSSPTSKYTFYDLALNSYIGWEDNEDTWIAEDSQWYSADDLPYYKLTDRIFDVYLISQHYQLPVCAFKNNDYYVYTDSIYSYQYLHDNFGITITPSTIYSIVDGNVKCWYNADEHQYWHVDLSAWKSFPPSSSSEGESIDITSVNQIGATGYFLFYDTLGSPHDYGDLVDGSNLQLISISFPNSGQLSYTKIVTSLITGTWRLLSPVPRSSLTEPCVVFARKISDDSNVDSNTVTSSFISVTEYNL